MPGPSSSPPQPPPRPDILQTNFDWPITNLIDKANNEIEMVPKTKKEELGKLDLPLSTQFLKLFSEVEDGTKIIDDKNDEKINEWPIQQLTKILSKIDKSEVLKQLNFIKGRENKEFENMLKSIDLSANSIQFFRLFTIWFLSRNFNTKQTHIQTRKKFFNNLDTNESIYDFFLKQENIEKVNIHSNEFTFTDSYGDYFEWLVHGFKQSDDRKYDALTNKSSKYLLHWFNNFLQRLLERIKADHHSVITDDHIALDVIQNENWQYFIQTILKTFQTNNGGINNTVKLKTIPPSIKASWRRRSEVSLCIPATSQVRLKWNTHRCLDGTSPRCLSGASLWRLIGTS